MKLYDIKMAVPGTEGKTFWRTIGTIFASDQTHIAGAGNKPAGFAIDYPSARGIVVPRSASKPKDDNSPPSDGSGAVPPI